MRSSPILEPKPLKSEKKKVNKKINFGFELIQEDYVCCKVDLEIWQPIRREAPPPAPPPLPLRLRLPGAISGVLPCG